ncbi:MAG: PD40 domain-containing protein [Bacteroidales bacterium]|nr:PD40 domain-containing protein [Bacteroidales bacterium]
MNNITIMVLLILLLASSSCEKPFKGYKFERGSLPETPVNLSDFNTAYDDYNSTAPSLGFLLPFCFSTNRNSQGNEFDIIYQPMNVNFDKTTGILKVTNEYDNWGIYMNDYEIIKTGLTKITTTGNEFGPNLIPAYSSNKYNFTLLYSTDITGNSQINFTSNKTDENFSEPEEVSFLNSEFEDMYPAFNSGRTKLNFCSNRNGARFDFYFVNVNPETDIELLLSENLSYEIFRDTVLSSSSDDKCPFFFEDKMVFASNREGGYGGYDLYYSILGNGIWCEPINFGETINTEFDEFRPVLIDEGVSQTQTMMVFSSNRPGGLGGFDLYFVGIAKE